jgi:hypothetical protein
MGLRLIDHLGKGLSHRFVIRDDEKTFNSDSENPMNRVDYDLANNWRCSCEDEWQENGFYTCQHIEFMSDLFYEMGPNRTEAFLRKENNDPDAVTYRFVSGPFINTLMKSSMIYTRKMKREPSQLSRIVDNSKFVINTEPLKVSPPVSPTTLYKKALEEIEKTGMASQTLSTAMQTAARDVAFSMKDMELLRKALSEKEIIERKYMTAKADDIYAVSNPTPTGTTVTITNKTGRTINLGDYVVSFDLAKEDPPTPQKPKTRFSEIDL